LPLPSNPSTVMKSGFTQGTYHGRSKGLDMSRQLQEDFNVRGRPFFHPGRSTTLPP
jgi:hypothetical protein